MCERVSICVKNSDENLDSIEPQLLGILPETNVYTQMIVITYFV